MLPDTINAIGMISLAAFTVATIVSFRRRPIKRISWGRRTALAIGAVVFTLFIFGLHHQRCVEVPDPYTQFELTALCLISLILFVDRKSIMAVSCAVTLYVGSALDAQFMQLVHYSSQYATIDANTDRPMAKGCNDMESADGIVAVPLWHTRFTGIYQLHTR